MNLYLYQITLIDPVFFSREGISGAFTPPYIHATALNHAVASSIGRCRADQPYIMSDKNGGRNTARYENSRIENSFYLTPARLQTAPNYYAEVVKGDGDRAIEKGYGSGQLEGVQIGRNEVLKAYRLFSLAPESVFEGYLYSTIDPEKFPRIIRLGSFRSVAVFKILKECRVVGLDHQKVCDHAADPLVNRVLRGVMVPMLPYPIINQPLIDKVWEIRRYGRRTFVAALSEILPASITPKRGDTSIF